MNTSRGPQARRLSWQRNREPPVIRTCRARMPDVVEDAAFFAAAAAAAAAAIFADDVVDVADVGRIEADDGDAARTRAVRRGAGLLLRWREARFDAASGLVSRPCGTPPS